MAPNVHRCLPEIVASIFKISDHLKRFKSSDPWEFSAASPSSSTKTAGKGSRSISTVAYITSNSTCDRNDAEQTPRINYAVITMEIQNPKRRNVLRGLV